MDTMVYAEFDDGSIYIDWQKGTILFNGSANANYDFLAKSVLRNMNRTEDIIKDIKADAAGREFYVVDVRHDRVNWEEFYGEHVDLEPPDEHSYYEYVTPRWVKRKVTMSQSGLTVFSHYTGPSGAASFFVVYVYRLPDL